MLDYGSGNLRSAERALARVGAEVTVTDDAAAAVAADGLVVPGVGAFAACMAGLDRVGGARDRREAAGRRRAGARDLRRHAGALRRRGRARRRDRRASACCPAGSSRCTRPSCRTWAGTRSAAPAGSTLFAGLDPSTRFYFVHSYAAHSTGGPTVVDRPTTARTSSPRSKSGLVSATQFHPEKSGDAGATVLENWLKSL